MRALSAYMTTVDIVAGPVSSGIASGTTAMLAPTAERDSASCISPTVARASAGCAFSIDSAAVSSSIPPPTWKPPREMPKKDRICRPSKALAAITMKTVTEAIQTVRRRCAGPKPWV